jgi:membrane associated rhomboid family serine protease
LERLQGIVAALFHVAIASYILHNGNVVLARASGAISAVFGIAAVAGNTRAYYGLVLLKLLILLIIDG